MSASERDPHLDRLFDFINDVYAFALTLLAVGLVLPAASENLRGEALLQSILDSWPKMLSFLTSFTLIAIFWQGQHRALHYLRRFDGRLAWLVFLQLLCIVFLPFPTAIVGEHVSDPVAQEFYFGSILVTGLATMALWWYVSSEPRLVDPELDPHVIRYFYLSILGGPVAFPLTMMVLITVGLGRLVNPLVLGYLIVLVYILLGVLEWWEQPRPRESEPMEGEKPEDIPEDIPSGEERRKDSDHHTNS